MTAKNQKLQLAFKAENCIWTGISAAQRPRDSEIAARTLDDYEEDAIEFDFSLLVESPHNGKMQRDPDSTYMSGTQDDLREIAETWLANPTCNGYYRKVARAIIAELDN